MTEEAQRIAIAKVCGWLNVEMHQPPPDNDFDPPHEVKAFPRGMKPHSAIWWELPYYFNDLNAMHEVEKTLSEDEYDNYGQHLMKVTGVSTFSVQDCRKMLSATAAQRREAFLRVKGLWVD